MHNSALTGVNVDPLVHSVVVIFALTYHRVFFCYFLHFSASILVITSMVRTQASDQESATVSPTH